MPYNSIYRLRLYGRLHSSQMVNVLHFVQEEPLATIGGLQLAQDFVTNMRATLIARAAGDMVYDYVEVQSIVPFSGGPETVNFPGGSAGTASGNCASATLCEVITVYTSRAGRRGRGRIYLPGASTLNTNVLAGQWLSPQTTRTQALATALANRYMVASPVGGWTIGVWSRVLAGPDPPWPSSAFVRATALTVRTTVRTQRRRQVGVGR